MQSKKILAVSAMTVALMAATPALADDGKHDGNFLDVKLGAAARFLNNIERGEREAHVAASSSAQAKVNIKGSVTAVNGSTITLSGKDGAQYTVNAASATITGDDRTIAITDIKVGDTLKIEGTLTGTVVTATKVKDQSIEKRDIAKAVSNLRAGIVTAVNGPVLTITRFGTGTSSTVNTNASTTVKIGGKATTTSAIAQGDAVVVVGTSASTTPDSITASVIYVLNQGFGWVKHFFVR